MACLHTWLLSTTVPVQGCRLVELDPGRTAVPHHW